MAGPSIFVYFFLGGFSFYFAISIGSKLKSFGRFVWALGDIYLQVRKYHVGAIYQPS